MRSDFEQNGYAIKIVAINNKFAVTSQGSLAIRCTFDCLQDTEADDVWGLMGGQKDDFFIYREGGALAPGGYLRFGAGVDTNLSTQAGYQSLRSAIVQAYTLGAGRQCDGVDPGGMQLPGNINQDDRLDLVDAIALLGTLFQGDPAPCDEGDFEGEGNRLLLDSNGDGGVDLTDVVHLLNYLFRGGPPMAQGTVCRPIAGCPDNPDACAESDGG
jgi:hypothetical protein